MPGKPYRSKLRSYHDEIFALLDGGMSYRQVAQALNRKYGIGVTHNAVFSYVKPRRPVRRGKGLFYLHRAVMDKTAMDIMKPVGRWKQDFNGTTGVIDGKSVYMEYAAPSDVPRLMERWLAGINGCLADIAKADDAARVYARAHMGFVRGHPFFDGNGRVARLIANLPVLRGGYPPIVVPRERRADYIDVLWEYQNAVGPIKRGARLLPPHPALRHFETLVLQAWVPTVKLVEEARHRDASQRAGN